MSLGSGIAVASVCALIGFIAWASCQPGIAGQALAEPPAVEWARAIRNGSKSPLDVRLEGGTHIAVVPVGGVMVFTLPSSVALVYDKRAGVYEGPVPVGR